MEQEKTEYRKRLERDLFYSYHATYLIFSEHAVKHVGDIFGITPKEMRVLAAARLFMNVRQFARPKQLQKIMKFDKFRISYVLKEMAKKGFLELVEPDVVRRYYNKPKIRGNHHYYRMGEVGKKIVKEFNKYILQSIRDFDKARYSGEYTKIKLDDKFKAI